MTNASSLKIVRTAIIYASKNSEASRIVTTKEGRSRSGAIAMKRPGKEVMELLESRDNNAEKRQGRDADDIENAQRGRRTENLDHKFKHLFLTLVLKFTREGKESIREIFPERKIAEEINDSKRKEKYSEETKGNISKETHDKGLDKTLDINIGRKGRQIITSQ